jgi:DNA-binding HxlR family transcriptional regulator
MKKIAGMHGLFNHKGGKVTGKILKKDCELLNFIADYKFITVRQLSALSQRSCQVLRRRLRVLVNDALVTRMRAYGRGSGRPEELYVLTEKGRGRLQKDGIPSADVADITDKKTDSIFVDHDFLVNWFRIHLLQIERIIPSLSVLFLTAHSNTLNQNKGDRFFLQERIPFDNNREKFIEFIPDGVFSITNNEAVPKRTLLFFLEVDMGTETIASMDRNFKDVRQKIINYQALFHSGGYKRHERVFDVKLNGFRLLFLANTPVRLIALCRLAKAMPPSDFVWLTDQEQMFSRGVSADIWARGGRHDETLQSILGPKLSRKATVVDCIR